MSGRPPSDQHESPLDGARHEATTEDMIHALAIPGLGVITLRRLLDQFGSWKGVLAAGKTAWREAGLSSKTIDALRNPPNEDFVAGEMDKAREAGVSIIPWNSPEFPTALRTQDDLPMLLYAKGSLLERDALAIAVVGARKASIYGKMMAERFSFELAQAGFTVISGLAHGVDAAAHAGALKGGGRTIAVLGNGLSRIYPPEHEELAERVAASGAVVSELPMDAPPVAGNFPARNRIIAALSLGVLVVEAARTSGSLITARLAGEMGREVFAIPGDVGRPQTRGVHRLIRDGATLVETVQDILDELGPLQKPLKVAEAEKLLVDPRALALNPIERKVFDLLDGTPRDIDTLTRQANLSAANTSSILMVLELKRLAIQMPGQQYVRAGTFVSD